MLKTDRFRRREEQLAEVLKKEKMEAIWKRYVKEYLRDQPITDLHDNYDFHINIKNRLSTVNASVLDGLYQPRRPIRLRSEKQHGISRHLIVLEPEDALVMEALGEHLSPIIRRSQPSKNAYYSRNLPKPKSVTDIDDTFGYPWWILWPEFQKRILEFAQEKNFIIVTDVATYYDTVDFTQLRNFIASLDHFSEIYLDLLFFILERFVWRPDYLPYPGRGLPQVNLDTPRLLAHAFLFEIDEFLKQKTNDHFVRWMDDIDFGCDSKEQAQILLRNLDELLLSRGLHLNSSKTKVLNHQEAFEHFQLRENRYLNIFQERLKRLISIGQDLRLESKRLRKRFRDYIVKQPTGQRNKVIKRYFTIFGYCQDPYLEEKAFEYIYEFPELRASIFRYLIAIGWSRNREEKLKKYILVALDDDSFFEGIKVLLNWKPDSTVQYILRMRKFVNQVDTEVPIKFIGALWLIGKFGSAKDIDRILRSRTNIWKNNDWIARQVVSLWSRMKLKETRSTVENVIQSFGLTNAMLVLENFEIISKNKDLFKNKVKPYIIATNKDGRYPLPKLLITLSILSGTLPESIKNTVRNELLKKLTCNISKYYIKCTREDCLFTHPL
jgi:hypothetical protein